MTLWNTYHLPQKLNEALTLIAEASGTKCIIAGGTDLILDLKQGRHPGVDNLIDVTAIPELKRLDFYKDKIIIGSAVSLNELISYAKLMQEATALYEACCLIGGPQVRNVATLGGNVAHALPAADGAIALFALDAQVEIASIDGTRVIPIEKLYQEPGKNSLKDSELLTAFIIPLSNRKYGSAFSRIMRPQGVAIAIENMAIWLEVEEDCFSNVRIAIGPSGPIPFRARKAEAFLSGKQFSADLLEQVESILKDETHFRTSPHRASSEYRNHLVSILLRDTWGRAWSRCQMRQ